ncbi:hypothetical protein [Streptomyces colonosanans]|nr:hypothetical protein [Streptomyces colonosanans]
MSTRTIVRLLADDDWQVVKTGAANPSLPVGEMEKQLRGASASWRS